MIGSTNVLPKEENKVYKDRRFLLHKGGVCISHLERFCVHLHETQDPKVSVQRFVLS